MKYRDYTKITDEELERIIKVLKSKLSLYESLRDLTAHDRVEVLKLIVFKNVVKKEAQNEQ